MTKPRGLGKGLAELIPVAGPAQPGESVVELSIGLIDPNPFQPRREFKPEELAELSASIQSQGLLQPVTVRRAGGGRYQLIAGERRLRATRDLGRTTIRAIVREVDDRQLLELSLVENLIRADLNAIEVAEALASLQAKYGYTVSELAAALGRSRPAVSNTLRLLELPESVRSLLRSGQLDAGHGRALLAFPPGEIESLARQSLAQGWSVRELERRGLEARREREAAKGRPAAGRVNAGSAGKAGKSSGSSATSSELKRAEQQLMEHLGTRVSLSAGSPESGGEIRISYHGIEDLQRLLDLLLGNASPF